MAHVTVVSCNLRQFLIRTRSEAQQAQRMLTMTGAPLLLFTRASLEILALDNFLLLQHTSVFTVKCQCKLRKLERSCFQHEEPFLSPAF